MYYYYSPLVPVTIRHQFKARPINPEIFRSGGECGVRRVAIQPVTKAVSPCLATKERFSAKRGREEMEKEEEKREFKANRISTYSTCRIQSIIYSQHTYLFVYRYMYAKD